MKISFNNLKKTLDFIWDENEVAKKLISHTAEVEEIIYESDFLKNVLVWEVVKCEKHPESERLNCTIVDVNWQKYPIVCWAPNIKTGLKVPVALVWTILPWNFEIKKSKIRWETSEWMICSEDELWLVSERQATIMELACDAKNGQNLMDYLKKDSIVLEIDNKAINHRPDLFSHIWIKREISTIYKKDFLEKYLSETEFLTAKKLEINNEIPEKVARYMALKISGVKNSENTDEEILDILSANYVESKGFLVDLSNYSLYYYWQPTHIFDADKINWNITLRFAKSWENFIGLDDKEYKLTSEDIVVSDSEKILALAWIIGGKNSCISENTKNIIIESANFDQAILRKTGKKHWVRTDSLNIFEKWLLAEMAYNGMSLIFKKLKEYNKNLKIEAFWDSYEVKQKEIFVDYDLEFINNLIGKKYENDYVLEILKKLWLELVWKKLKIPFWRKDLNYKADIAEEIARIDGYDNIESSVPKVNSGAVIQDNIYNLKNDARNFFVSKWFFDTYNYSFVWEELYKKLNLDLKECVSLKNYLSLDSSHLRNSLIPNIIAGIGENIKNFSDLKTFEFEKVFKTSPSPQPSPLQGEGAMNENYSLAWVIVKNKNLVYFDIQNIISDFFNFIWVDNFSFNILEKIPEYAHSGRVAKILVRWKEVWIVWEIHPTIAKRFDIENRIGFFEINIDKILWAVYKIIKAKEISIYQENNFDLSFLVDKKVKWADIKQAISNTDKKIIDRVELFDIYENEEKIPQKRSLSFKIFINSLDQTLDDKIKNELIENIIKKVEKKGGELR